MYRSHPAIFSELTERSSSVMIDVGWISSGWVRGVGIGFVRGNAERSLSTRLTGVAATIMKTSKNLNGNRDFKLQVAGIQLSILYEFDPERDRKYKYDRLADRSCSTL
jgi:hypothetical protein